MSNHELPAQRLGAIEAERLDRHLTNCGQSDDLQILVDEDEMFRPAIDAWVEESMILLRDTTAELLSLAFIAK